MMDGRYPGTMTHTGGMHVKRIPQLWPLIGLLLLPWGAGAAPLTLHDCLALAAGRQADILTGRDNVTSAQAHAVEAHSSYLPQVTVGTAKELVTAGNPLVNTDLSTDLTVTQMIFDGGQRELTYKSAKSAVTQSQAVLLRTQETVNFTITKDYLALLRAQALAKVSAQQTTYIEGQLKQVQARVEAGQAADVDALPIKAQLATAQVDTLTAANNVRQAAITLQQAIGLDPEDGFAVQDVPAPAKTLTVTIADALAVAKKARPELVEDAAGLSAAKNDVTAATLKLYPVASVAAQYDQPMDNNGGTRSYGISAGLSWCIYSGGKTQAGLQDARASLDTAHVHAAQTLRDITVDVQQAVLALDNARERLGATALSVEAAQRNFDAQQGRYDQGMAIPLDLLNAQLSVATAQSNAVQAQYDYLTALAQLHYATGQQGEVPWN